jgi:predicted TIM-barrel fold metal-dependent hydrolase
MQKKLSRRSTIKSIGAVGALAFSTEPLAAQDLPGKKAGKEEDVLQQITSRVSQTLLVDTHEHLIEEQERLAGKTHPLVPVDDWTVILNHYFNSDLLTAGMPRQQYDKLFSRGVDPVEKWKLLEPFWPAVKNTGYGKVVRIVMKELYGVAEPSSRTIQQVQLGYERERRPGFYAHILKTLARIESCQVNCLSKPFEETAMPLLLMQDLSIVGMFAGPDWKSFGNPTGLRIKGLEDWHRVIDWWFAQYGRHAVAVKSQNAYDRDIDYERVEAEKVILLFAKRLNQEPLSKEANKLLEDHLFWYAVRKATENNLPVKLHTGYYAGENSMPLGRISRNPASASELCRLAADTRFIFMHISYPYYEEMIALAKHYSNAYIDMCWSWIINPVAAKDFLKKYLVTAPANKILTFGGDYIPVECVLGHAQVARQGIAQALSELVLEKWLTLEDALELVEPIMRGNARNIFNLQEKESLLAHVRWDKSS